MKGKSTKHREKISGTEIDADNLTYSYDYVGQDSNLYEGEKNQRIFVFDPNRCLGCQVCRAACTSRHELSAEAPLRRVDSRELQKGDNILRFFISTSCHHCINPECLRVCPSHAIRKRRDGTVILDSTKCTGCGACVRSCPFKAPIMLKDGVAMKCDLCFRRVDEDSYPFCVDACPVKALQLITKKKDECGALVRTLPGVPRIQITQPSIRFKTIRVARQGGLRVKGYCETRDEL